MSNHLKPSCLSQALPSMVPSLGPSDASADKDKDKDKDKGDKFLIQTFESSFFHAVCGRQSGRKYMQDFYLARPSFPCSCAASKGSPHQSSLFVVSDGHGPSPGGEYAAQKSVRFIEQLWRERILPRLDLADDKATMKGLTECFLSTNERILDEIDPKAGTTCTTAFIHDGKKLFIANVGDSSGKVYNRSRAADEHLRALAHSPAATGSPAASPPNNNGEAALSHETEAHASPKEQKQALVEESIVSIELTKDHKPEDKKEQKRIHSLGGSFIENNGIRVGGILNMTRAMGNGHLQPYVTSKPSIRCLNLPNAEEAERMDSILVLASDGLWGYCDEADIIAVINKACHEVARMSSKFIEEASPEEKEEAIERSQEIERRKPSLIAQALGELAKKKNSNDNLTIIVVLLTPKTSE